MPERLRGVITTKRYTNPRLPYFTLPFSDEQQSSISLWSVLRCIFLRDTEKTRSYVFTKKTYQPVTDNSPLFAVDCEMVSIVA